MQHYQRIQISQKDVACRMMVAVILNALGKLVGQHLGKINRLSRKLVLGQFYSSQYINPCIDPQHWVILFSGL